MSEWTSPSDALPDWYVWVEATNEYFGKVDRYQQTTTFQARRVETGQKDEDGESLWKWQSNLNNVIEIGVTYWRPRTLTPWQKA